MFFLGNIFADVECCICYTTKCAKSGYEGLVKCESETVASTLQICAVEKKNNSRLMASVAGFDIQSIVAHELHYHRTCHREYTRPNQKKGGNVKLEDHA